MSERGTAKKGGIEGEPEVLLCVLPSSKQMAAPAVTPSLLRLEGKMDGFFVIAIYLKLFARDLFISYSQDI